MGAEAPETCWATHKRQLINLWNSCILLVDLSRTMMHGLANVKFHFFFFKVSYIYPKFSTLLVSTDLQVRIFLILYRQKHSDGEAAYRYILYIGIRQFSDKAGIWKKYFSIPSPTNSHNGRGFSLFCAVPTTVPRQTSTGTQSFLSDPFNSSFTNHATFWLYTCSCWQCRNQTSKCLYKYIYRVKLMTNKSLTVFSGVLYT